MYFLKSEIYKDSSYSKREYNCIGYSFINHLRAIKEVIYPEVGDQFDSEKDMTEFFKDNLINKHDFIIYNKDDSKYYSSEFKEINITIKWHNGYKSQQDYLDARETCLVS